MKQIMGCVSVQLICFTGRNRHFPLTCMSATCHSWEWLGPNDVGQCSGQTSANRGTPGFFACKDAPQVAIPGHASASRITWGFPGCRVSTESGHSSVIHAWGMPCQRILRTCLCNWGNLDRCSWGSRVPVLYTLGTSVPSLRDAWQHLNSDKNP